MTKVLLSAAVILYLSIGRVLTSEEMPAAATKAVEALRIWRVRAEDPVVVEHGDPASPHREDVRGGKKPAESITEWLEP